MAGPIGYSELFDGLGPGAQEILDFTKNVRGLNTAYKTFSKNLEGDSQKIAAGLALLASSNQNLRAQTDAVAANNKAGRASLDSLNAAVTRLIQDQQQLKQQQAGLAKVQGDTEKATKGVTSALRQQQDALRKAFAAGDMDGARKAAAAILTLKAETDNLTRALRGANSDYTAAQGSFRNLENEARALDARLKSLAGGMDNNSEEAKQLKAQLAAANEKMRLFTMETGKGHLNVGRYAESLREVVAELMKERTELQANATALRAQAQATNLTVDQQERLQKEIKETEQALTKNSNSLKNYGVQAQAGSGLTANLSTNMSGLAQNLAGSYYGIQGVATALQKGFELLYDYSDAASDVKKNTGQTKEEFEAFVDVLKTIPTRTPLSGLLNEAKIGGQLGKTKAELEGFVRSIDTIVVALGDDFPQGVEQISNELGTLELIFKKNLGPDQEKNLLSIGNALNQLSADGRASAPYLSDVATRVGNVAANMKISLPDVLAYAAVLQENGVNAEVASSSLGRLFSTVSNKRGEAFKIAKFADTNLTIKEFTRLINTDMQAAVNLFLRGLKAGGTTTTRFNDLLGTLKLTSGEAKAAITTLANQTELFSERQKTANFQIREGSSVIDESIEKQGNFAASVDRLGNTFKNFFTEGVIGDFLKEEIDTARGQLQLLIDGFNGVKSAVIGARDAIANSKFGKAVGLDKAIGGEKPAVDQYGALAQGTKSLVDQANASELLATRYKELAGAVSLSRDEQDELSQITKKLEKDFLGSGVSISRETGAIQINIGAIEDEIFARRRASVENEKMLSRGVENARKAVDATKKLQTFLGNQVNLVKIKLDTSGIAPERFKEIEQFITERRKFFNDDEVKIGPSSGFSFQEVKGVEAYLDAQKKVSDNAEILTKQQKDLTNAEKALNLVRKAGAQIPKDDKKGDEQDINLGKAKTKVYADEAKALYELKKQRLEARATDLDRQSKNPANTKDVQLDALRKAAAVRRELAELERNELIREAAKTYKDQIGGQAAFETTRLRLREAFKSKLLDIDRDLSEGELAIRNALLDQLAQVDRLMLEQEIDTLDEIAANENLSGQERRQAAFDASAKRIDIILNESAIKRRAAKGDLDALAKIQAEEDKAVAEALKKPKANDADLSNGDLEAKYTRSQLALEKNRAMGLFTEKQYQRALVGLEDKYLDEKLENLKKDATRQREAAELEVEITRRKNERKTEEEQKAADARAAIIQEGLQKVQEFSDAFFEIGDNRRAQELENLTRQKDNELKVAGENEELKAQIEENYRKKELAIRQKQAKADKARALFSVALNTAAAVTSVLSTGGGTFYADLGISAGILSAIVIAQGLAQAAVIASKPIPQYFKGREGGPAEFALVAERGPELIEGRSGGSRLVETPQITYLQQGDTVYTAEKTRRILDNPPQLKDPATRASREAVNTAAYTASLRQQSFGYLTSEKVAQDRQLAGMIVEGVVKGVEQVLNRAFQERPQYITEPDGMFKYTKTRNGVTKHLNKLNRRNFPNT